MNAEHDARLQTRYGSGLFDFVPKQVRSFQTIRTFCLKKSAQADARWQCFSNECDFTNGGTSQLQVFYALVLKPATEIPARLYATSREVLI